MVHLAFFIEIWIQPWSVIQFINKKCISCQKNIHFTKKNESVPTDSIQICKKSIYEIKYISLSPMEVKEVEWQPALWYV